MSFSDKKEVAEAYADRLGLDIVNVRPAHGGRHVNVALSDGTNVRVKWTEKPFYTFSKVFDVDYQCDGVSLNKREAVKCANLDCDYIVTGYGDRSSIFRVDPDVFVNWALENDTLRTTRFQPNGEKEETVSMPLTEMEIVDKEGDVLS